MSPYFPIRKFSGRCTTIVGYGNKCEIKQSRKQNEKANLIRKNVIYIPEEESTPYFYGIQSNYFHHVIINCIEQGADMRPQNQAGATSLGVQTPDQEPGVSLSHRKRLKLKQGSGMVGFARLMEVPLDQGRGCLVEPLPRYLIEKMEQMCEKRKASH